MTMEPDNEYKKTVTFREPRIEEFDKFRDGRFIIYLGDSRDVRLYALGDSNGLCEEVVRHYNLIKPRRKITPEELKDDEKALEDYVKECSETEQVILYESEEDAAKREASLMEEMKKDAPFLEDEILGGGFLSIDYENRTIDASGKSVQYGSLPNALVTKCLTGLGYRAYVHMSQEDIREYTQFWTDFYLGTERGKND